MKKTLLFAAAGILFVLLLFFGIYTLSNSRTYQLAGRLTAQVETDQKVVALTFDDGPAENTDQILSLLDQHHAKATFFLIGQDIEKHPEEAKKIVDAGHQVGNHTYSHQRMVFKSSSFIQDEIEKTDRLIRASGFDGEIDVRPPYGKKLFAFPYYLSRQDREMILWNLEPDTYFAMADDKVKYVKENVEPGSIILMHPMYDQSGRELQAVEGVLQALSEAGYQFVTVNELQELAQQE